MSAHLPALSNPTFHNLRRELIFALRQLVLAFTPVRTHTDDTDVWAEQRILVLRLVLVIYETICKVTHVDDGVSLICCVASQSGCCAGSGGIDTR